MKDTNRIVWADFLRLIAILMVICIHCADPFNVSPEAARIRNTISGEASTERSCVRASPCLSC